jgi:hypothetical protein
MQMDRRTRRGQALRGRRTAGRYRYVNQASIGAR